MRLAAAPARVSCKQLLMTPSPCPAVGVLLLVLGVSVGLVLPDEKAAPHTAHPETFLSVTASCCMGSELCMVLRIGAWEFWPAPTSQARCYQRPHLTRGFSCSHCTFQFSFTLHKCHSHLPFCCRGTEGRQFLFLSTSTWALGCARATASSGRNESSSLPQAAHSCHPLIAPSEVSATAHQACLGHFRACPHTLLQQCHAAAHPSSTCSTRYPPEPSLLFAKSYFCYSWSSE